jgi:hypothetical protein
VNQTNAVELPEIPDLLSELRALSALAADSDTRLLSLLEPLAK